MLDDAFVNDRILFKCQHKNARNTSKIRPQDYLKELILYERSTSKTIEDDESVNSV